MERTCLRISTVAALQNGGHEPSPTMAGSNVFDSLDAAADDLAPEERAPVIIVRTEDDDREYDQKNDRFISRTCQLVMSLAICHGGTGSLIDNIAETDSNAEGLLDLMEYQCFAVLQGYGEWGRWWRRDRGGARIKGWRSRGLWPTPRTSLVRLAAREIVVPCWLNDDCVPGLLRQADLAVDSSGDPIEPVAVLPASLIAVFDHIAANAAGDVVTWAAGLRAALEAEVLPVAGVAPDLLSVRAKWFSQEPPSTSAEEQPLIEAEFNPPQT